MDVNCAAIPETLLEAEMFGFERGAFTDARQAKVGLFQAAHRGTIFLDEVGLLPDALQAKLLKVIEEQAVRRLGSTRSEPVDVWVLTATSEDLAAAARERRFREDLYHRLAVLTLWLPPLRERGQDILLLAEHSLAAACTDYQLPPKQFDAPARAALLACRWPGNIRELNNVIERVVLLTEGSLVTADMLGLPPAAREEPRAAPRAQEAVPLEEAVGSVEREHLLQALQQTNWNISRAAALLGISRNTLRYRIEKHGLRPGVSPGPPRREVTQRLAAEPTVPVVIPPRVPAPTSVRWERRRLTLLRAELVPPRQERPSVDASRQLEVFVEKVQIFGGRVEELSPTGIVAAFGLEPVEDAPKRAVLSAMAIQKAVEHARSGHAEPVAIKISIHVGQFLVGHADGATKIDLDAKRQAWAVLEGLVGAAELDALVVSEAAAPFLERRFDLIAVGSLERTAGRSYRLVGRERTGLGFGGRMTRFVGRDHELELLRSRLAAAMRGQGQVVGLMGEPGMGKSRLLFEFRQGIADQRITYLEGYCVSYGNTTPYLPILEIVRASFRITEADTPEIATEKVSVGLRGMGMEPTEWAPYLFHLLGLKDGTDRLALLTPEVIKARTFEALRQLSISLSRQSPLIIVVEDLHWIDSTTEEFLAALAEAIPAMRILLVTTYRFGYRPPWLEKSYATQLALQPLTQEESRNLVRLILGADHAADALINLVLSKTEGNPFFLEEMARAVREQGGVPARVGVPDTIQEVLLARIDRLPSETKRLLQSASVIGKNVPLSLLQAIVELPPEELRRVVVRLQADEFLYEISAYPEPEYTLKHALTHEVAYESLLPEQRRALHARTVDTIEQLHPNWLTEQVERLAYHAFRGEVWDKAVSYLRQAGVKAASRSAHREAVVRYEQALEALKHLTESRETIEQAIDLQFDLRNSLHPLGEFRRILDHLRKTEELAEKLGDQRRLGQVFSYVTQYFRLMGDPDRAIECGQRALTIAAALGDFAIKIATNTHLGPAYSALGDYRRAIEILRENIESLHGDLILERLGLAGLPSVLSRIYLVLCLAELGEFSEGLAYGEEGIRIAETADDPYSLTFAYFGVGTLFLLKGELPRAIPALERGLGFCRALNLLLMFPLLGSSLGVTYALSERFAEAIPLLEQAVEQGASINKDRRTFNRDCSAGRGLPPSRSPA